MEIFELNKSPLFETISCHKADCYPSNSISVLNICGGNFEKWSGHINIPRHIDNLLK